MKIHIAIPTYNSASYIGKTLDTIYEQSSKPDSISISDNGSSDSTVLVVSEYPVNRLLINEVNKGAVANHNALINIVPQGEHIWLLSSDDYLISPDVVKIIRQQVEKCEDTPDVITVGREGGENASFPVTSGIDYLIKVLTFNLEYRLIPSLVIFCNRGRVIEQTNQNGYTDDAEFYFRMLLDAKTVLHVPTPCVHYRLRQDSDTALTPSRIRHAFHYKWMKNWLSRRELGIGKIEQTLAIARFFSRRRSEVGSGFEMLKLYGLGSVVFLLIAEFFQLIHWGRRHLCRRSFATQD